jgi:polyphosphate kinase
MTTLVAAIAAAPAAAQVPADAGQVWKTYDIGPFVKAAGPGSEKHVVDWVLQDTGYASWHGGIPAVLTADAGLTGDAETVFQELASQARLRQPQHLVAAPFGLHKRMLRHLEQVRDAAARGADARVVLKANALTDPALIAALADAARAGASVDLVIRGACMLPPGLPGITDRIRVRSVIGRFLEHSRIVYFRWGNGEDEEVLYLSSADWMSRNMFRRVELAWPIRDPLLRQRIIDEALVPYLHDTRDAWELDAQGRYARISDSGVSAQAALMGLHSR